ncbi:MAG: response regulator, partial [Beijerinckiaceae bacterium]|nr:response regulator [Beijerinckiaceae bacterium]
STVGTGSCFSFALPIVTEPAQAAAPMATGRTVGILLSRGQTGEMLAQELGRAGYAVCSDAAVLAQESARFDLVLASPDRLPACRCRSGTVVVVAGPSEDADALIRAGAAEVLTWPVQRRDLSALLAALQDGQPLRRARTAGTASPESLQFPGLRVLVADDSEVNREVADAALRRFGIAARFVEDGLQAVAAVEREGFDLILMDGSMPGLDGFEATRAIRAREAETGRARVPIVALTAHVVGTAADAWREADMDDVVHKPFTLARLGSVIAALAPGQRQGGSLPPQPAPESVAAEEGCLDEAVLHDLIAMTNGSIETARRIAELYRVSSLEEADRLADATRAGDGERIARCAHALKSMSANLGAKRLAAAAAEMERAAREDATPPGPESYEVVAGLLQRTHREIEDVMARAA